MSKYTRCPRCSEYVGKAADLQIALEEAKQRCIHCGGPHNRHEACAARWEKAETALARAEEQRDAWHRVHDIAAEQRRVEGQLAHERGEALRALGGCDRPIHRGVQCGEELAPSPTSPTAARLAAAEKLVEALRYIARPGYGLQGLVEDNAPEAEYTRYWARTCDRLQAKAREALTAYEATAPAAAREEK